MINPSELTADQIEWELPGAKRPDDLDLALLSEVSPGALLLTVARLHADCQALRLTLSAATAALHAVTKECDEWRTLRRR